MAGERRRRNTPQRRMILEQLRATTTHPTAAEIYAAVREQLPRVSLGTVYRNLDVLHLDGLIHKIETAGSDVRYDGRRDAHNHVRCTGCGALRDVPESAGVSIPLPQRELAEIAVTGYRLEFLGLCRDCRYEG